MPLSNIRDVSINSIDTNSISPYNDNSSYIPDMFISHSGNRDALNTIEKNTLKRSLKLLDELGLEFITIAGGAPRDLYFKKLRLIDSKDLKDFDIFFYDHVYDGVEKIVLERKGFEFVTDLTEEYEDSLSDIKQVFEAQYKGLLLNIITLRRRKTKEEIINNFSCSLSKFELDITNNKIIAYKEALLSIASKTLIFKDGTIDHYKRRMKNYFPSYSVGTYQSALFKVVDNVLSNHAKELDL